MKKSTSDRIRQRVNAELDRLSLRESPDSIDEIEDLALELRRRAGEIAAEELARELSGEGEATTQKEECTCGRWARYKGVREHSIVTMAGPVRVARRYYYCRKCDAGFCPADAWLGCTGTSFTLRVRQETARLASLASSHKIAVELLYDLAGICVSESHSHRILAEAGEVASTVFEGRRHDALNGEEICKLTKSPAVLYVECDGVQTPTVNGYKEMKVGVVLAEDAKGKVFSQGYTAQLMHCEDFGEHWYALASRYGATKANLIVVLGDGAKWIWNQAQHHFPEALQILDFWHVIDRLAPLARTAYGEGTTKAKEWLNGRAEELRQSQFSAIMGALEALSDRSPAIKELVNEQRSYLESNQSRMDYAKYLSMGLRIGSGAVESACKRLVSLRLKGPGMRWLQQTAQTIARLRALIFSNEWNEFKMQWNVA